MWQRKQLYFVEHSGEATMWVNAFQFGVPLSMDTRTLAKTSRNNAERSGRVNAVARSFRNCLTSAQVDVTSWFAHQYVEAEAALNTCFSVGLLVSSVHRSLTLFPPRMSSNGWSSWLGYPSWTWEFVMDTFTRYLLAMPHCEQWIDRFCVSFSHAIYRKLE